MFRKLYTVVTLILLSVLISGDLFAETVNFYVSTRGRNTNNGLSPSTPFATITKAITSCTSATTDYVINLAANSQWGYYSENVVVTRYSGTNFNSLTITGPDISTAPPSEELETARIQGIGDGSPVIRIDVSNVTIKNLRIYNARRTTEEGFYNNLIHIRPGVQNVYIYRCYIGPQTKENAVWQGGDKYQGLDPWYELSDGVDFEPAGCNGIFIDGTNALTSDITIEECAIYYITGEGEGIKMYAPKTTSSNSRIKNVHILGCSIVQNRRSGIVCAGQVSDCDFQYNGIWHNGWYHIDYSKDRNSSKASEEYGNGIVIYGSGGSGDISTRSNIDMGYNSVFDNFFNGIYIFGGATNINVDNECDVWGNKDGIVVNSDPTESCHPGPHSGSVNDNFSSLNIRDALIHSNYRFGIYYNTTNGAGQLNAEGCYFEEPPAESGWGGPDLSNGPKFGWGSFNHNADMFYGQTGTNKDGGRDNVNTNSVFYDPEDANNYLTLPSVVYGPVDINPFRNDLINKTTKNIKVDNSETDNNFDNIENALNTVHTNNDIIDVQATGTPYTETDFNIGKNVTVYGVEDSDDNLPELKYQVSGSTYIPPVVSTGTGNVEMKKFKLTGRDGSSDLIGTIKYSSSTGNIAVQNSLLFTDDTQINLNSYSTINNYLDDNTDHHDGRGVFTMCDIKPSTMDYNVLWLDASNITDKASGESLSLAPPDDYSWKDLSGSSNHAKQSSSSAVPKFKNNAIDGRPGIDYSYTGSATRYLQITPASNTIYTNSAKSLFVMFKTGSDVSGTQVIFEAGNPNSGFSIGIRLVNSYQKLVFTIWRGASPVYLSYPNGNSGISPNTQYFARLWYDGTQTGTNFRAYVNNEQVGDGSTFTNFLFDNRDFGNCGIGAAVGGARIGAGSVTSGSTWLFKGGNIAEIMLFNNYSTTQWGSVRDYFLDKYSLGSDWPRDNEIIGEPVVAGEFDGDAEILPPYPNPFSETSEISVRVKYQQNVRVDIFDAMGRIVSTIYDGQMSPNNFYALKIDGSNLPSGVYVYRVAGENFTESGKIVLTK